MSVPLQLVIAGIPEGEPENNELTFENFWLLVVKKSRKYETKMEWNRLEDDEKLAAMIGAVEWRRIWLKSDLTYVVDPCRWVKYRRWEDELPVALTSSHASHQPAQSTPLPPRTTIPDSVRAVLAKLRGQG